MIPCNLSADLRRFERLDADAERMSVALLNEARDEFLSGSCCPNTPENIAEALANLQYEPSGERLMQKLSALASARDTKGFGLLLLAGIEDYWQAESLRIVERRSA